MHTGFYSKKLRQFFSEQTVLQTFTSNTLSKMTLRLPFLDTHISYWEHHHMAHRYHSFCQRWFHRPISQCNLHWTDTNLTCTTMCLLPHCKFTLCVPKGLTATRVTQTVIGTRLPSRVADAWCHALAPGQGLTAPLRHENLPVLRFCCCPGCCADSTAPARPSSQVVGGNSLRVKLSTPLLHNALGLQLGT